MLGAVGEMRNVPFFLARTRFRLPYNNLLLDSQRGLPRAEGMHGGSTLSGLV